MIELAARKAAELGFETEILSKNEIKVYPTSKEKKVFFYHEVRKIKEEHPQTPLDVIYDHTNMQVLSNEERKKEISKIGELVRKFRGFIEVNNGNQVNCYMKSEATVEVIKKNLHKWYDMIFWLDDQQTKKSPLFINVRQIYRDGEAMSLQEKNAAIHRMEEFAKKYGGEVEIISRSEVAIYVKTEKQQKVIESFTRKYNGLKVYAGEQVETFEIQVKIQ